ncbi:MAG: hypothetical protein GC190_18825 [Alphaproteobacteria bacterium]|nr:hypothetical protein [Alphaproteobacteria bacterium]
MWQMLATVLVAAAAATAAQPDTAPAAAGASPNRATQEAEFQSHRPPHWRCFVRDAMVFYDRVHVRCYNKTAEGVTFFAVDTSQPIAVSLVTKALSAMQQGRPVKIAYAPDTDLNPPGCRKADCRRLLDIRF